jgi:hypothetical protein
MSGIDVDIAEAGRLLADHLFDLGTSSRHA